MNGDTRRRIRREGEKLLRALNRELYLNAAGLKQSADTRAIFDSHREFEEPELFRSARETGSQDKDGKPGNRLLQAFLAGSYLSAKTSRSTDDILSFETKESITADRKTIPFRAVEAEILSEPKKHKRDEIISRREEKSKKLLPLLRQKLALITEGSEELGFSDYGSLRSETDELDIMQLSEHAALFLKDTEYVSKDMLGWFLGKVMDLKLKDASLYDLSYLFNADELKGYFPTRDKTFLTGRVLEETGLTPEGNITLDEEKRKGKKSGCLCFPLDPPREIAITLYPAGGVRDYDSYFKALGRSLCYAFTEPEDDFEFRFLREEALVMVFSELFGNLVYEPKWLRKYLRIDAEGDFMKFLNLRRLMSVRITAGRTVFESGMYRNPDMEEMPGRFREIMENASHCKANESEYISGLSCPLASACRFNGLLLEPALVNYLRENFDEEWWRIAPAGDFLKDMWCEGGRVSAKELSRKIDSGAPDTVMMSEVFEKVLG